MSRKKTIEISGINIVTQPHSPEGYIKIIKAVNQKPIAVYGHDHLMVSGLRPHLGGDWTTGIEGELVKFSNIDEHAQWVNITSGQLAEGEEIPNIPSNIRPNGALFPFIFHLSGRNTGHRLFYISKSYNSASKKMDTLSPNLVKKLFTSLFEDDRIRSNFSSIEVTVIPEKTALSSIFRLPKLSKLFLQITPPNPDDLETFEQEMLSRLSSMNVEKVEQTYYGETGESLEPDQNLRQLATVASHNGYVKGTGKNSEGVTITLSTTEIPMKEPITVDNDGVSEREALRKFKL